MVLNKIFYMLKTRQFGLAAVKMFLGIVMRKPLSGPYDLQVSPVSNCNYKCDFCYAKLGNGNGGKPEKMSLDMFKSIVRDGVRLNAGKIDIGGHGEPTLHPDILEMLRIVTESGLYSHLTTNGSRLDKNFVDELLKNGLGTIVISVNSLDPKNYMDIHGITNKSYYDNIINILPYLSEQKKRYPAFSMVLSFAIDAKNYHEVGSMLKHLAAYDINNILLNPVSDYDFSKGAGLTEGMVSEVERMLSESEEAYRGKINYGEFRELWEMTRGRAIKSPCYAGFLLTFINSNGDVMPCCLCRSSMGNVKEKSLYDIWYSEEYSRFREKTLNFYRTKDMPTECECATCPMMLIFSDLARFTSVKGLLGGYQKN